MAVENIKAMLAHKYNPDKADYPAYIQPKLDGVRCLFTAKGAFSRTGKQFMNVYHIEQLAQRVAKIILDKLHEGLLIDMQPDEEEDLLAELARCMTLMSKYLAEEKYEECELLKKKIKTIAMKQC